MRNIKMKYKIIEPTDTENINLIKDWYFSEWGIPITISATKICQLSKNRNEFQILLEHEGRPVATAGLYNHVGLIEHLPALGIYKHWLAMVYTCPADRGKGYGSLICKKVEEIARDLGVKQLSLFTHTAEAFYTGMKWDILERHEIGGKQIVIMHKMISSF